MAGVTAGGWGVNQHGSDGKKEVRRKIEGKEAEAKTKNKERAWRKKCW